MNKNWFMVRLEKNSVCGSARLCQLDWVNAYTDNFFEPLYLHVHRMSDDTFHRVYPRRKNITGIGLMAGVLYWTKREIKY